MLNVESLSCQRGYNLLFENLSFQVKSGSILRIIGTNGCGKTSLLKILAGLSFPEKGTVTLDENSVKSEKYQQNIFYLGHLSTISTQMTSLENLAFLSGLNLTKQKEELSKCLDDIGLKNYQNELCGKLSAGQKRLVVLASLLTSTAKLWLLDEPFTALDTTGIKLVEAAISQHCQQRRICVFTSHQDSSLPEEILTL